MVKKTGEKKVEKVESSSKKKTFDFTKFLKKNYGLILAGVLAVVLLSFLIFGNITGKCVYDSSIDESDIEEIVLELYDKMGYNVEVSNVVLENNFYKVSLSVEDSEEVLYFTLDGKNIIPEYYIFPVKDLLENAQPTEVEEEVSFSDEDLVEISSFMQCLASKDVKIYGANWCGYTQALVENLGGFEVVSPIYVECTEETELCSQEGVEGYPTIKIAGEVVNIDRTLQGFADASGCEMPAINVNQVSTNVEAGC